MSARHFSLNEIAKALGVSRQAIEKRAKKEGWKIAKTEIVRGQEKRLFLLPEIVNKEILKLQITKEVNDDEPNQKGSAGKTSQNGRTNAEIQTSVGTSRSDDSVSSRHIIASTKASRNNAEFTGVVKCRTVEDGKLVTDDNASGYGICEYDNRQGNGEVLGAKNTLITGLNTKDNIIDGATKALIHFVKKSDLSVKETLDMLNEQYAAGTLNEHLTWVYENCWSKKREQQVLTRDTYNKWVRKIEKIGTAAPKRPSKDFLIPAWGKLVLQHYRKPNKPTLTEAIYEARKQWQGKPFSDGQVRRVFEKLKELAPMVLYKGRNTGAALKAKMPFTKRLTDDLYPNEVWIGDGHGLKAKIAHPDHGRPFTPEVTVIMDVYSRKVVGWSISYSENVIAVCDALRHAVSTHGLPLIYYSDNGSGQTARQLDAPIIGMLSQLGIDHQTGIPGNPQGRGLIERSWQTITIPLAKKLATYRGNGADGDTLRIANGTIEKSLRKGKKSALLPTMNEFKAMLEDTFDWYNNEHIHSEHNTTPSNAYAEKARDEDIVMLDAPVLKTLFMPQEIRVAARGVVKLWNNEYFNHDLMQVDGQKVLVGYDIHDANFVTVRRQNGEFVCVAEWNAHAKGFMPQSLRDKKRYERYTGQIKRAEQNIFEAEQELNPPQQLVYDAPIELPVMNVETAESVATPETDPNNLLTLKAKRPPFDTDASKYRWLMLWPEQINMQDEAWITWYKLTSEYDDLFGDQDVAAR